MILFVMLENNNPATEICTSGSLAITLLGWFWWRGIYALLLLLSFCFDVLNKTLGLFCSFFYLKRYFFWVLSLFIFLPQIFFFFLVLSPNQKSLYNNNAPFWLDVKVLKLIYLCGFDLFLKIHLLISNQSSCLPMERYITVRHFPNFMKILQYLYWI